MGRTRALLTFALIPLTLVAWWYAHRLHTTAVASLYPPSGLNLSPSESPQLHHAAGRGSDDLVIRNTTDNVFYFVQVTDIHVSLFNHHGGLAHLLHFLSTTLPTVSPAFVVATGDLTDGKDVHMGGSLQHKEEWMAYRNALEQAGVLMDRDHRGYQYWNDIRGNHDCFNVPSWKHRENYYAKYGASRQKPGFDFVVEKPFGKYRFVAFDAVPKQGIIRPFSFFGYVDRNDMDRLQKQLRHANEYNHTVLMGHYPLTTVAFGQTSDGQSFDQAISDKISLYLSGHLHTLIAGLGDHLKAHKRQGFLEIELGDMKQHALYRIIAVDHDLISFRDLVVPVPDLPTPYTAELKNDITSAKLPKRLPQDPIVLITNPKDARYLISDREPVERMKRSEAIRMLVWSDAPVKQVEVTVDGVPLAQKSIRYAGGRFESVEKRWTRTLEGGAQSVPLWVAPWQAGQYADGQAHTIVATAIDSNGRRGTHSIRFRLDGQRLPLDGGFGEWLIATRFQESMIALTIGMFVVLQFGVLLIPRMYAAVLHWKGAFKRWHSQVVDPYRRFNRIEAFWTRLVLAANEDAIFYPLYLFGLYLFVGPWLRINMVPSAGERGLGDAYMYGVYMANGEWVPIMDLWSKAFRFIPFILGAFPIYMAHCVTPRLPVPPPAKSTHPRGMRWRARLLMAMMLLLSSVDLIFFYSNIGLRGIVLWPGRSWPVAYAVYLLWRYDWTSSAAIRKHVAPATNADVVVVVAATAGITNTAYGNGKVYGGLDEAYASSGSEMGLGDESRFSRHLNGKTMSSARFMPKARARVAVAALTP